MESQSNFKMWVEKSTNNLFFALNVVSLIQEFFEFKGYGYLAARKIFIHAHFFNSITHYLGGNP